MAVGRWFQSFSLMLAGSTLLYASAATAFGFNMGDNFNEGFDFDKGSDLDMGGSKMNWESPDNVWDTGTSTHKGFSWGGGPRSAPGWGFRDAPPPAPWGVPNPYAMPSAVMPPQMVPYGAPPIRRAPPSQQPQRYRRPPAPLAPTQPLQGSVQ
ncbi:MAG: hypothetical protein HOL04_08750 [Gammaproteobacteria bacterium]|jgi:hypothetical protein|nr:hypothetical protein [Gammaproteobacteria bacterium]MBT4607666.1 hypothetical protein [Thiotrichales bacterium]MBT3472558.1 hypothetical protein [Gammaproteobacteria bacterium]MBT3966414.1 hypothetical protein [Gammaproteobacteria bacterium]MBT4079822.1 hypothetical protein [Gammaproteobacteria bacterium]